MVDRHALTVRLAANLVRTREISAVELAEWTLDALALTEPHVHAYAYIDPDAIRESARQADRQLATGVAVGPLHGVPIGLKDVVFTSDMPTRAGSRVLADDVSRFDARIVHLLREAGALITGKLVTHEFAYGQDTPPTRNAWHLDQYPGGSSAGAGVAVAVGSALGAIGTDSGGSVRKPAALNGVSGLKPTFGRISHWGVLPVGSSLDHVGVLARTADDCGLLLEVLGRHDPADASSLHRRPFEFDRAVADLSWCRLGVLPYRDEPDLDPEIGQAVQAAVEELARMGASLVEVDAPPTDLVQASAFTIFLSEAAAFHHRLLRERASDYAPATRRALTVGALISAVEVDLAQRARRRICAEIEKTFADAELDAIVSPTSPITSIPMDVMDPSVDVGRFLPYLLPPDLTGQLAITVPCGLTSTRSPVGLQISGRPMADDVVVAIAASYQAETTWHELRPDVAIAEAPAS